MPGPDHSAVIERLRADRRIYLADAKRLDVIAAKQRSEADDYAAQAAELRALAEENARAIVALHGAPLSYEEDEDA